MLPKIALKFILVKIVLPSNLAHSSVEKLLTTESYFVSSLPSESLTKVVVAFPTSITKQKVKGQWLNSSCKIFWCTCLFPGAEDIVSDGRQRRGVFSAGRHAGAPRFTAVLQNKIRREQKLPHHRQRRLLSGWVQTSICTSIVVTWLSKLPVVKRRA